MQYEYKTKGTCSQRILFEINDGKVENVQFIGGCNGNLQGISKLVEGMDIVEKISTVDATSKGRPRQHVKINKVTILEGYGK